MSNLYPQLRDCRTRALRSMIDTLTFYGDRVVDPEEAQTWHALALMCDDELRFRDPRRKPIIPRDTHLRSTER